LTDPLTEHTVHKAPPRWGSGSKGVFGMIKFAVVGFIALAFFAPASASARPACTDTEGYYVNSDGRTVHRPKCTTQHQNGETAICRDGSHSFSLHHSGTCSHHGGVATWE